MGRLFFYRNMAKTNLKNHAQLYIPYVVVGMMMSAMFYILYFLANDETTSKLKGGGSLPIILTMGTAVVGILSVILLLYTNSFLMKRRKKEFGLYNVLGLEKRHIVRIMFFELFYSAGAAIILGMGMGILMYKGLCLLLVRLMKGGVAYGFFVSVPCLVVTVVVFVAIYAFSYIVNCISIARMKTIELLHSSQTGEREPKIKWVLVLLGCIALGIGYYIAITTKAPLKALGLFFVAALLVMLGTYFLFVAGSIAILKGFKKNKSYYYHPKHMTAVSGLLYRMKQNAVGLASICILSTAVLVVISTTLSLYAGVEEYVEHASPYDVSVSYVPHSVSKDIVKLRSIEKSLADDMEKECEKNGLTVTETQFTCFFHGCYGFADNELLSGNNAYTGNIDDFSSMEKLIMVCAISAEQYKELTGENISLGKNEVAMYTLKDNRVQLKEEFKIDGMDFKCVKTLEEFPMEDPEYGLFNCFYIVMDSDDTMNEVCETFEEHGIIMASFDYTFGMNVTSDKEDKNARLKKATEIALKAASKDCEEGFSTRVDLKFETEDMCYGFYGGLFFLGITLGVVFMIGLMLIIYYKQISEGYEDRERFQIMLKVGMSKKEVSQSIKSQILQVFFLPLVVAIVHLSVAFPMLARILKVLSLAGTVTYVQCTLICVAGFAVIYGVVYAITARVYYKIVTV